MCSLRLLTQVSQSNSEAAKLKKEWQAENAGLVGLGPPTGKRSAPAALVEEPGHKRTSEDAPPTGGYATPASGGALSRYNNEAGLVFLFLLVFLVNN